ncbi:hypothetical protein PIB30_056969, partial [Stylosanthes scabra]|nr:hypothetical protein [Stylosanthes scabra]
PSENLKKTSEEVTSSSLPCQQPSRRRHPPTRQNCSSLEGPPASSEDTIRTRLQTLSSLCIPRRRAAGKRENLEIEEERGADLGRRQRGRKLTLLASLWNLKDVAAELMPLLPLLRLIYSAMMCVASLLCKRATRLVLPCIKLLKGDFLEDVDCSTLRVEEVYVIM